MIANTNLIYAPVSIYDIQTMFNVVLTKDGETKVSNDLGTIIGKKINSTVSGWTVTSRRDINKWAKYKPIKYNKIGMLNPDNSERASVNYGITNIPTWSGASSASANLVHLCDFWINEDPSYPPQCGLKVEYWQYELPEGGSTSPFRLTDFVKNNNTSTPGYNHNAVPEVGDLMTTQLYITPTGQLVVNWNNGTQDDTILGYSDFNYYNTSTSLGGFHFGCVFQRGTSSRYTICDDNLVSNLRTLGAHMYIWFETTAEINSFMGGSTSTYDTVEFACTPIFANQSFYNTISGNSNRHKFISNWNNITADKFVALTEPQTVTVTKTFAELTASSLNAMRGTGRNINYSFALTNTESDVNRAYQVTVTLYDSRDNIVGTPQTRTGTINGGASIVISNSIDGGQYYNTATRLGIVTDYSASQNQPLLLKKTNSYSTVIDELSPY